MTPKDRASRGGRGRLLNRHAALALALAVLTALLAARWRGTPGTAAAVEPLDDAEAVTHDEGFLIWRPVPITWPLELRGDVFRRVPREEAVASDPDPEPRPEPKPTIDPDAVRAEAAERLSLAAVLYGREPRAVINASTVSEGEWVSGYLVRRIEKTRVLLERDGVSIELRP